MYHVKALPLLLWYRQFAETMGRVQNVSMLYDQFHAKFTSVIHSTARWRALPGHLHKVTLAFLVQVSKP